MKVATRALAAAFALWIASSVAGPGGRWSSAAAISSAPALGDLRSVDELKTLFNRDRGKPRLVLLLSPT
jgi:hypothetical protein